METVSFCLLPVGARHRFTTRERAVYIRVLRPSRVMTTTLTACASIVMATLSIWASATTGIVYGLSLNNNCSFTSIRVYANGAKTERIKIFSGASGVLLEWLVSQPFVHNAVVYDVAFVCFVD